MSTWKSCPRRSCSVAPVPTPDRRRSLGAAGEAQAAAWYAEQGYELVARNWRCRSGELDLIVRKGRTYVFCEVKTRSSAAFGSPAEAVTRTKQARIHRLAVQWLHEAAPARPNRIRFDVAAILDGRLDVLESAF